MTIDPLHPNERRQMEVNRASWDERVSIHVSDRSGYYDVDAFLAGRDTLMPIEASEVGDVHGLKIVHLQCHFGLDTLSLARRGAHVTGVDFSSEAIAAATKLAQTASLEASFECANIYDVCALLTASTFDLAYVTWGTLGWLPDVHRWAKVIDHLLADNGRLYLADKHPSLDQLISREDALAFNYPWRSNGASGAIPGEKPHSYAGDEIPLTNSAIFEWTHPLSDIITSLINAGLRIDFLHEHDTLPWKAVRCMVPASGNMYKIPDQMHGPPTSFSLMATKQSG